MILLVFAGATFLFADVFFAVDFAVDLELLVLAAELLFDEDFLIVVLADAVLVLALVDLLVVAIGKSVSLYLPFYIFHFTFIYQLPFHRHSIGCQWQV
ncbi:MAG: hypothetical protein ACRD4B_03805 [Acidobacteriota bacterium]